MRFKPRGAFAVLRQESLQKTQSRLEPNKFEKDIEVDVGQTVFEVTLYEWINEWMNEEFIRSCNQIRLTVIEIKIK